jgi:AraC-like DNA-binding protein
MRYFENRRLRASLTVKQHISAIIHEATQTFDLSERLLVIQGILFKGEDRLWGGEQSIFLRLELMLLELLRENFFSGNQKSRFLSKELAADPLCCRVIEFLEEHLCERLDIDALCKALSFSRSHISKRFRAVCGFPIARYFNRMKIEEAKRLIRETKLSFFEISERLSLCNSHYFSNLFVQFVGMSPTQYKQSCK